jgi:hypothetical protein
MTPRAFETAFIPASLPAVIFTEGTPESGPAKAGHYTCAD